MKKLLQAFGLATLLVLLGAGAVWVLALLTQACVGFFGTHAWLVFLVVIAWGLLTKIIYQDWLW